MGHSPLELYLNSVPCPRELSEGAPRTPKEKGMGWGYTMLCVPSPRTLSDPTVLLFLTWGVALQPASPACPVSRRAASQLPVPYLAVRCPLWGGGPTHPPAGSPPSPPRESPPSLPWGRLLVPLSHPRMTVVLIPSRVGSRSHIEVSPVPSWGVPIPHLGWSLPEGGPRPLPGPLVPCG